MDARIHDGTFGELLQEVINSGRGLLRARYGLWALLKEKRASVELISARTPSGLPALPPSISGSRVRDLMDFHCDMPRPFLGVDKRWNEFFLSIPLSLRAWAGSLLYVAEKEGAHGFGSPDVSLAQFLVRIVEELERGNKTTIETRRVIRFMHEMLDESSATCITDPARSIVFWSRGAQDLFGYTEGEALGQSVISLLVPPEVQPKYKRGYLPGVYDTIVRGDIARFKSERLHKDGRWIDLSTVISPFCYQVTGITVCVCLVRFEAARKWGAIRR